MSELDWLFGLQGIGVKLGLDNMRRLIAELEPPNQAPLTIHVAGTNGKGSVCAFADALLRRHGLKTGLFTSPHLIRFQERMRVDGAIIDDQAIEHWLGRIRRTIAGWEPHPSFFEVTLALALQHFYHSNVDAIVLETGLGGRLDATNALEPRHVSVITSIGYDHTRILGDSLGAIAREKAGIMRPGVPVVSAQQAPEARDALLQAATERSTEITFVEQPYAQAVGLAGNHQRWNAAVAIAAVKAAGIHLRDDAISWALENTRWAARFHQLDDRYVIDGAHNTAAAQALTETWRAVFPDKQATLIFGCARDKQPQELLEILQPICARIILTSIRSARAETPENIAGTIDLPNVDVTTTESFDRALEQGESFPELILIAGSLFLAGEALARLTEDTMPRSTEQ